MIPKQIYGVLAEFKDPKSILKAAEDVKNEGYIDFDCHTPFPVHGLDDAMGLKRSIIGYIVGLGCIAGASAGLLLQWWSSTVAYPVVISGKPLFSWQAFMIITFVLMVLGGAFSALIGMFHLNRMPTFHHPLFNSEKFKKASDDTFFVSIEFKDPKFDMEDTKKFLLSIGGENIEVVEE
jgi:hypothetical protein